MLAYILAIAIAIGSLGLYLAAFLFPDLHRKDDFLWSGVGLFYALVLWVCAGRITGGVLLGQTASVLLLGWFGWQTMIYRKAIARPDQQAEILKFSLLDWIEAKIKAKKPVISTPQPTVAVEKSSTETQEVIAETKTDEGVINTKEKLEEVTENKTETEEISAPEALIEQEITSPKIASQPDKKGFSFGKLVNKILAPFSKKTVKKEGKSETKEDTKKDSLLETLKDDIWEEEETVVEQITTEIIEENRVNNEKKNTEEEPEIVIVETEKIKTTEEEIKEIEENKPKQISEEIIEKLDEVDIQGVEKIEEEQSESESESESKTTEKEKESGENDNPFKELTS